MNGQLSNGRGPKPSAEQIDAIIEEIAAALVESDKPLTKADLESRCRRQLTPAEFNVALERALDTDQVTRRTIAGAIRYELPLERGDKPPRAEPKRQALASPVAAVSPAPIKAALPVESAVTAPKERQGYGQLKARVRALFVPGVRLTATDIERALGLGLCGAKTALQALSTEGVIERVYPMNRLSPWRLVETRVDLQEPMPEPSSSLAPAAETTVAQTESVQETVKLFTSPGSETAPAAKAVVSEPPTRPSSPVLLELGDADFALWSNGELHAVSERFTVKFDGITTRKLIDYLDRTLGVLPVAGVTS